MKKVIALLLVVVLTLSLVACGNTTNNGGANNSGSEESKTLTLTGSAEGFGGPVDVEITVTDGVVEAIDYTAEGETPTVGGAALPLLVENVIKAQSLDIDAVSGATVTSTAFLEALGAALESGGVELSGTGEATAEVQDTERETDVVIIGAGGAGLTAALTVKENGKEVLVVESQALAGGNSSRSTGGMNAAKTVFQDENEFGEEAGIEKTLAKAAEYTGAGEEVIHELAATVQAQYDEYKANPTGYFDSSELFQLDTIIGGSGLNNPELVKTLVENSAAAVDWLEQNNAILHNVAAFGGASVKRIHRPVNEEGKVVPVGSYLVQVLTESAQKAGVEVLYSTTANKIIMEDGKAVGIEAVSADGSKVTIKANAVIIATGGFGANNDMIAALNSELDGYITTNAPGAQGQGIVMAQEAGAATVDMEQIQLHPTVHVAEDGSANLITEGLRGDGAILVNQEGLRFFDEVSTRDKVSAAENNQTGKYAWLIVDQKMMDASAVIQGYHSKGWMVEGNTPEELAEAMGSDPETLAKTIETWNSYVAAKNDPDFGRTSFANPLEEHFYALTVQPGVHHTMGGIAINSNAEVLDENGAVIPGLYAAGEVTGGVHGSNRLGGNAVADIIVFGRIAGEQASK